MQLDGAPLPLDRIAAAYPRPNQPGALSATAAAAAGLTLSSGVTTAVDSLDCIGVGAAPVQSPLPRQTPSPSPRPAPRKRPSGRRRNAREAAGSGQQKGEGAYAVGGNDVLGVEFVAASGANDSASHGAADGSVVSSRRRGLLQTSGNNKFYYGQWSNM